MNENKNGFTLIELLATVGLLSILLILFVPGLLNTGNTVKNESYNNKIALVETAANSFVEDNKN